MNFETIKIETDARGAARLILSRPDKHNALSGQMIEEVTQAAGVLAADPSIRVVVLEGAGKSFCAGGDLGWMQTQVNADGTTRAAQARKLADMLGALNGLPKPLIGRVHGNAFGGGVGLCCVCDIVFAADTAKFGLTETKLGLTPATIGPYVLARMGEGAARQVFMSSRLFDAQSAQRLGVVSQVVAPDGLEAAVEGEIDAYLKCAPGAVAEAKALALSLGRTPDAATVDASINALVTRWESNEAAAGIAAFFEKTPPAWAK